MKNGLLALLKCNIGNVLSITIGYLLCMDTKRAVRHLWMPFIYCQLIRHQPQNPSAEDTTYSSAATASVKHRIIDFDEALLIDCSWWGFTYCEGAFKYSSLGCWKISADNITMVI
jgi:hypothetical protein